MVSVQSDSLSKLLEPFGISSEESRIYLVLLEKGVLSALQISRELNIGRTKVYRLLDKLEEKGLVSNKFDELGFKFAANSPTILKMQLLRKEKEHEALKESFPLLLSELDKVMGKGEMSSKVLYYTGVKGLEQVTYNSSQAKGELRIFEMADMSVFLDYGFCEKVRKEFVKNKVHIRELTNLKKVSAWTRIAELVRDYWKCRYIDPRKLKMRFEILIYNNVYVMYQYRKGDIFCVEIYNDFLALMQKQVFDYLWKNAKPMKVLNKEGGAVYVKRKS